MVQSEGISGGYLYYAVSYSIYGGSEIVLPGPPVNYLIPDIHIFSLIGIKILTKTPSKYNKKLIQVDIFLKL